MDRSQEEVDALKGAGDKGNAEKAPAEEGGEQMEVAEAGEQAPEVGEQAGTSSGAAAGGSDDDEADEGAADVEAALSKLAEAAPDPAAFRKRVMRLLRDTDRRMEMEAAPPEPVERRVRHLRYLQLGLSYLRTAFDKEVYELQRRHHDDLKPLRERRRLIVQGLHEPTPQECAEPAEQQVEASPDKGIPGFWLRALRNSLTVGPMITERDGEVLQHLVDIRVVMQGGDQAGFTLEFHFEPNAHLYDAVLTKQFDVSFEPDPADPLVGGGMRVLGMRGSGVTWRTPDADVTRLPRSGAACDSFFHFFARDVAAGASDDEELDAWERDVDIGLHLQKSLVPRAVLFYTGEAAQTEYSDTESYSSYSSRSSSRSRTRSRSRSPARRWE